MRDAILARHQLSPNIETTGRIELIYWFGRFLRHILPCFVRKYRISTKIRVRLLSFGTLFQTLLLENFAKARRSLQRVVSLVRQTAQYDKMASTVVGRTMLTILATVV